MLILKTKKMSKEKSVAGNVPVGFLGLLTILFVGLKLGKVGAVASWSWWWVLSPLWLPSAIALGFSAIALGFSLICTVIYLLMKLIR